MKDCVWEKEPKTKRARDREKTIERWIDTERE
jgi:hypothetical protein